MLRKIFMARSYRKIGSLLAERSRGGRDAPRVRAEFPWMDATPTGGGDAELIAEHAKYCREVSSEKMAVSLQAAAFLARWCAERKPRKVVDLGSGFSSWVLRRHAKAVGGCEVWSVDDDAAWLGRTRDYLVKMGVPTERVMTWPEFVASGADGFDLVFHDAGSMQFRADNLGVALDLAAAGGTVLLDDVHRFDYRVVAQAEVARRGLECLSTHAWRDGYGRYQYIVRRR